MTGTDDLNLPTVELYGCTNQHLYSVAETFTGMRFGYDSLSSIPTLVKYSCQPATGGSWRGTWPCWTPPTGSSSSSSLNPPPQNRPCGFDKKIYLIFTLVVGCYSVTPLLRPPGCTDYTLLCSPPGLLRSPPGPLRSPPGPLRSPPAGTWNPPPAVRSPAAAAAGTCGRSPPRPPGGAPTGPPPPPGFHTL